MKPLPAFHCPRWPRCDCPDGTVDRNCPGLETLAIPPGNQTVNVCDWFPDCGCEGDCGSLAPHGLSEPQFLFLVMLFGLSVCGLGLLVIWVR